jgi:hypothetical protein
MTQKPQTPKPERFRPYGRRPAVPSGWKVQTKLRDDSERAVRQVMRQHNLSASGAIHHLVRLGAGLDPLI